MVWQVMEMLAENLSWDEIIAGCHNRISRDTIAETIRLDKSTFEHSQNDTLHPSGDQSDMSVLEIETAITRLSNQDVAELLTWLKEYHAQLWAEQIEQDAEAGQLDAILKQVDEEYEAGLSKAL